MANFDGDGESHIVVISESRYDKTNQHQRRTKTDKKKKKRRRRREVSKSSNMFNTISELIGLGRAFSLQQKLIVILFLSSLFIYFAAFVLLLLKSVRSLPDAAGDGDKKKLPMFPVGAGSLSHLLKRKDLDQLGMAPVVTKERSNNDASALDPDKNPPSPTEQQDRNPPPQPENHLTAAMPEVPSPDDNKNPNVQVAPDGEGIPTPKWPVTISDESAFFEDIIHPGDLKTLIPVPVLWSAPLNDGRLMSPSQAARVGSYVNGRRGGGGGLEDGGDPNERTIFVAIASYRDWQCRYTVESIFLRAKFPNRIRVAVVDQVDTGDPSCGVPIQSCTADPYQALCEYVSQIDVMEIESHLAVGPVFARHLGHRMYRGEYYAMQIDAHVTFVVDWDVDIISQMEATGNEMAVLSTYLTDIVGSIDKKTGKSLLNTRPIMCNTDFEGEGQGQHLRHGSQPEMEPTVRGTPQLQPFWAAGFSFGRGHFVVNVPYDLYLPMIFQGEEISIALRGFTYGYDFYAPERSVCFHTYAEGENAAKRAKVPHFWENDNMYRGTARIAMKRLLGIIDMNPWIPKTQWDHTKETLYGKGQVRTTQKFFDTFGIHVQNRKVEQHLCQFVHTGRMHRQFVKKLRPDKMGIDYTKIDYKFTDPMNVK